MIHMMTGYTEEVDEVEDGIAEILEQIDLGALKKNSVGIITCHIDFTSTGFIGELCKKLPFDVIGMTTMANACRQGKSMFALSLTVLTSDDVAFEAALSGPLDLDGYRETIGAAYSGATKKLPGKPSFSITFFPLLKNLSGALMHRAFDDICEGVPFWGSITINSDINNERSNVFLNGDISEDGMAMIIMHGPVDPEFIVVSLPAQNIRKDRGRITNSDGCLIKEIDGIPALKFLESRGVVIMKEASLITPLMIYYEGSPIPLAQAIYSVNEDGSLLCGGEMPIGSFVTFGEITVDGILSTAGDGMARMLECGKKSGALILPCVTRYITLGDNHNGELELIDKLLENGKIMPYMAGYSGGEICPIRDESGALQNRFHGFTFSVCVL